MGFEIEVITITKKKPKLIKAIVCVSHLTIGGKSWHSDEIRYKRGDIIKAPLDWVNESNSVKPVTEIVSADED